MLGEGVSLGVAGDVYGLASRLFRAWISLAQTLVLECIAATACL